MGPRPFGRGRLASTVRVGDRQGLQWGRDLSVAEGSACSNVRSYRTCFNGAATFRSRKAPCVGRQTPAVNSFNGAATFRSRKVAIVLRFEPASRLQWGRDLSVAEGKQAHRMPDGLIGLQWGRDLSVAEGRWSPSRQWPGSGFNGAATFRSRKEAEWPPAQARPRASMGPRPFGRGRLTTARATRAARHASMGPRPFGRGRAPATGTMPSTSWLQWGRDLSVAEGSSGIGKAGGRHSFNGAATFRSRKVPNYILADVLDGLLQWGRDLSVAEGAPHLPYHLTQAASMGPRPFGRGRANPHCRIFSEKFALQWGRDLSVAEGNGFRIAPDSCGGASMGPRPFGRGRLWVCQQLRIALAASMGPRPFGRGRAPPAAPRDRR